MRKLASIQKIKKLEPISDADAIEKATVLGWEVVVKKGDFTEGDFCVYCEIDSLLPEREEFEFLRKNKFRIKTIKLKGQVSQGICFPVSILVPFGVYAKDIHEGKDVTDILGVKKWEPYQEPVKLQKQGNKIKYPDWMPDFIQKVIHKIRPIREYYRRTSPDRTFPSVIPKTDETRVQVLEPLLDKYEYTRCYVTEKLDGSSITVYWINRKFGVCSRKVDINRDSNNKYWKVVIDHDIENKIKKAFPKKNIAFQGELIGPGIQGNKYNLSELDIYFFNLYSVDDHAYGSLLGLETFCKAIGEKMVPIVNRGYTLENNIPKLVEMSKGYSALHKTEREGIVIRPLFEIEDSELDVNLVKHRVSFKVVNPDFLLKHGE